MYYVQGLLWDHLIEQGNSEGSSQRSRGNAEPASVGHAGAAATMGGPVSEPVFDGTTKGGQPPTSEAALPSSSSSSLSSPPSLSSSSPSGSPWEALNAVDPEMARLIHPNNVRKIQQSLGIFNTSGIRHSELIRQQHAQGGGVGGDLKALRYRNCGMIWLRAETDVLKDRLDRRVDTMMQAGLAKEIADLQSDMLRQHGNTSSNVAPFDPSRGVFQSIGFKEFDRYLALLRSPSSSGHSKAALEDALMLGVEQLKLSTKRYARRQLSWIRNRIVGNIPTCMFDATNVAEFDALVVDPAVLSMRHVLGLDDSNNRSNKSNNNMGITTDAARAKRAAENAQETASTFVREYNDKVRATEKKSEQRRRKRKQEAERRHARNSAAIAAKRKREAESFGAGGRFSSVSDKR